MATDELIPNSAIFFLGIDRPADKSPSPLQSAELLIQRQILNFLKTLGA